MKDILRCLVFDAASTSSRNARKASAGTSTENRVSVGAFTVSRGKIVEMDFLADPQRLSQLDLTMLEE